MEEYKFSDSNLDFYELLDKYKTLNTTYSDIDDFKINIYENCNLLQDLTTTFLVPSTNIRLSSFKNNCIIADTQTLDLDREFYTANPTLFSTVTDGTATYINNINLTNIIKTYFNYTNDDIYPSKKIIIKINLHKAIVDKDRTGALQIDMKEIKEHFHSVFDTLELDINQYVTGKHGTLEVTTLEPDRFQSLKGGSGQNANVNSAGPAINITNNDDYPSFKLNIKTNGKVSGGFGASGGRGGDGYKNATAFAYDWDNSSTSQYEYRWSGFARDRLINVTLIIEIGSASLTWRAVTTYYWDETVIFTDTTTPQPYTPATITNLDPLEYPDLPSVTSLIPGTNKYKYTRVYYDTKDEPEYAETGASFWSIRQKNETYVQTGEVAPTSGTNGSTATYSNNAGTVFNTQAGSTGTPNDGAGGTGGTKGNKGVITSITAANITIEP